MNEHATEKWLTLSQASDLLGVHPATLRQWSDEGKLELFRTPGGHRRFARAAIERLLRIMPVRGAGLPAFVASATVQRTREGVGAEIMQQPWMADLQPAQREQWRLAGRQLVGFVSQLTNAGAVTPEHHATAKLLGLTYARLLAEAGLGLTEAVLTFLFFRDSLLETVIQLPTTTGLDPEAALAALRRVQLLLNDVLRAMMDSFGAAQ